MHEVQSSILCTSSFLFLMDGWDATVNEGQSTPFPLQMKQRVKPDARYYFWLPYARNVAWLTQNLKNLKMHEVQFNSLYLHFLFGCKLEGNDDDD
jgi:hypothetical protein